MFAPILLLLTYAESQQLAASGTQALLMECEAALTQQGRLHAGSDAAMAQSCISYLDDFVQHAQHDGKRLCLHRADIASLPGVYVRYMRENPNLLEQPKILGVTLALAHAYPCPDTK